MRPTKTVSSVAARAPSGAILAKFYSSLGRLSRLGTEGSAGSASVEISLNRDDVFAGVARRHVVAA